jgi:2-keto-3-deoxy-L-rhamnonate aldolase RhmA
MRDNLVKQKLAAGGIAMGTMMLEFATSGIGRIAASAGAEFAVFDMEHTGWSMETIRMLMATSRAANLVPIVRTPALRYDLFSRALDVGAMGFAVPLIQTAEECRQIVDWIRYPPEGHRGCAFALAHDDFAGGDMSEKMTHANDNVLFIAQIETVQSLNEVDEIAAVDGVDALWIGQVDLSALLGIPGQFDHPKFQAATQKVLDACAKHGKAAGLGMLNPQSLCEGIDQGFRFLVQVGDLWIYQQALKRGFQAIQNKIQERR